MEVGKQAIHNFKMVTRIYKNISFLDKTLPTKKIKIEELGLVFNSSSSPYNLFFYSFAYEYASVSVKDEMVEIMKDYLYEEQRKIDNLIEIVDDL